MLKDYELHAREWIEKNADILNQLWPHRNEVRWYQRAFNYDNSITVNYGMTRVVLVGDDFVIKINKPKCDRWRMFGNSQDEVRMYKKACEDGYGWLFCPIRAMIIEHHTYYVMQKVDSVAEDEGYENSIDEEFYEVLGEEAVDYLNENVFDVHSQNFGFIHGQPIIFDYAANHC